MEMEAGNGNLKPGLGISLDNNHLATKKILIIEDEANIINYLTLYCEAEGYRVDSVSNGGDALQQFSKIKPDLVLLDLMLPGLDGMEVCRRIRSSSRVPIIIVTARREEVDKLLGLEAGADDYITKPFSPRELMARIRVIFRRVEEVNQIIVSATTASSEVPRLLMTGNLCINLDSREVAYNQQPVHSLTNKEFELLATLARHPGRVYTKSELEEALYGHDSSLESSTIGVFISTLRNKLPNPRLIETVYGVGYKLSRELI
jgi:DNA-binding response OmpR family regulator